ncbi:MAG TPA: glycoside hydrolase family 18 protein [Polyangiaceae bacterium]|nr:glycoside hydrolase family 18 protein [Polyangiaceae bacterium]
MLSESRLYLVFGYVALFGACSSASDTLDSPVSPASGGHVSSAGGPGNSAQGGHTVAVGGQSSGYTSAPSGFGGTASGGLPSSWNGGASSKGGSGNSANGGSPGGQAGQSTSAGGSSTNAGNASSGGTSSAMGGQTSGGSGPMSGGSPSSGGAPEPRPSAQQVIGYFAQWGIYQRNYRVKNIVDSGSAKTLTAINYAFGNIVNGECVMVTRAGVGDAFADYQKSFQATESVDGKADTWDQNLKGNFNQLKKLKALYPNIKVLISLGGWTWSKGFSDAALTPESRARVAKSCVDLYIRGNLPMLDGDPAGGAAAAAGVFDGVDIDWEYPAYAGDVGSVYRDEDTRNFTLLLEEFRRQLSAIDPKLLLTIAAPAGSPQTALLELGQIHRHLDWINLMSYDMHGAWDATGPTNFHAPLLLSNKDPARESGLSADAAIQRYLDGGVPASKLTLGLPFYGRGWTGVAAANNGLYQSASGPAPGTYEAGIEDYRVLAARAKPGFRDSAAGAYWTFDGNEFWSFDDPENIRSKTEYARSKGLGGVMAWSLDGDTADGQLMRAIAAGLSP